MDDRPDANAAPKSDASDASASGSKSGALSQSLSGTDSGSDTRAGSLQGGAATGSDDDSDAAEINKALSEEGRKLRAQTPDRAR